jgi:hypothetical protein
MRAVEVGGSAVAVGGVEGVLVTSGGAMRAVEVGGSAVAIGGVEGVVVTSGGAIRVVGFGTSVEALGGAEGVVVACGGGGIKVVDAVEDIVVLVVVIDPEASPSP